MVRDAYGFAAICRICADIDRDIGREGITISLLKSD
jgi:hypothetical protein